MQCSFSIGLKVLVAAFACWVLKGTQDSLYALCTARSLRVCLQAISFMYVEHKRQCLFTISSLEVSLGEILFRAENTTFGTISGIDRAI